MHTDHIYTDHIYRSCIHAHIHTHLQILSEALERVGWHEPENHDARKHADVLCEGRIDAEQLQDARR